MFSYFPDTNNTNGSIKMGKQKNKDNFTFFEKLTGDIITTETKKKPQKARNNTQINNIKNYIVCLNATDKKITNPDYAALDYILILTEVIYKTDKKVFESLRKKTLFSNYQINYSLSGKIEDDEFKNTKDRKIQKIKDWRDYHNPSSNVNERLKKENKENLEKTVNEEAINSFADSTKEFTEKYINFYIGELYKEKAKELDDEGLKNYIQQNYSLFIKKLNKLGITWIKEETDIEKIISGGKKYAEENKAVIKGAGMNNDDTDKNENKNSSNKTKSKPSIFRKIGCGLVCLVIAGALALKSDATDDPYNLLKIKAKQYPEIMTYEGGGKFQIHARCGTIKYQVSEERAEEISKLITKNPLKTSRNLLALDKFYDINKEQRVIIDEKDHLSGGK
jgi:hypothetical protein